MRAKFLALCCSAAAVFVGNTLCRADDKDTERQQRKKEFRLRKELESPYRKWRNEDVAYIISEEERKAFLRLATDEERQSFVEGFWLRRDPTPDTEENEFKEEHYRRIAYANQHFASGVPGWKTDRGKVYIKYGPADEVESHPSGGAYERPIEEGGGETSTYPFEKWRYRHIEGVGSDVIVEFVDPSMSGEYHMTMDPSEKDALLYVPNAGLTLYEQLGLTVKTDRFNRNDHLGIGNQPLPESMNEFTRLETAVNLQRPPKFRDLEGIVNSTVRFNMLPMKVQANFIRVTDSTIVCPITLEFERKDLQFQQKDHVSKAGINIFARISTLSRRTISTFEDVVSIEVPVELLSKAVSGVSIYQKSVALLPGSYRLNIVAKDVVGGNTTSFEMALNVPRFEEEKLASSSLILADVIEKVPTRSLGAGPFVIGDTKVRPRVSGTFARAEKLGIYAQFYNFTADEKTRRPSGTIDYEITENGSRRPVFAYREDIANLEGASASQITVAKLLPLVSLEPGGYTLRLTVTDRLGHQVLTPAATFSVK